MKTQTQDQTQAGDNTTASTLPPAFTEDEIAELIVTVTHSAIDVNDKAFYLHMLMRGLFSVELLEELMQKMEELKSEKEGELKSIQEELDALKVEDEKDSAQFKQSLMGALKQIEAVADHIEEKTMERAQELTVSSEREQIDDIRTSIINKKDEK